MAKMSNIPKKVTIQNKDGEPVQKKLKVREKILVKGIIEGKTQVQAMKEAGYTVSETNKNMRDMYASRKVNESHIQAAINQALELEGATPQWAVAQLKKVAEQDDELGAKRLASKDILELHGWNKTARPTTHVEFKGNFFSQARQVEPVIDVEPSDD